MQRTQIYLDEEAHQRLNSIATHRGTTLSHVIREAISRYIANGVDTDPTAIIDRACGLWADRASDEIDIRGLRAGWAQRGARLAGLIRE